MSPGSPSALQGSCTESISLSGFLLHLGSLALCQDLAIPCSDSFQGRSRLKDCSSPSHQHVARPVCQLAWASSPSCPYLSPPSRAGGRNLATGSAHTMCRPRRLPERPRCLLPSTGAMSRKRQRTGAAAGLPQATGGRSPNANSRREKQVLQSNPGEAKGHTVTLWSAGIGF